MHANAIPNLCWPLSECLPFGLLFFVESLHAFPSSVRILANGFLPAAMLTRDHFASKEYWFAASLPHKRRSAAPRYRCTVSLSALFGIATSHFFDSRSWRQNL